MSTNIFDDYRVQLQQALDQSYPDSQYDLPNFCQTASVKSPYLALLRDPSNKEAKCSKECSLNNDDPTSRNQKDIIGEAGVSRYDIVFWNFYAAFGFDVGKKSFDLIKKDQRFWGKQLDNLLALLPNIKVVVVCGKEAQKGICTYYQFQSAFNDLEQHIKPINGRDMHFIFSPLPSDKGLAIVGSRHNCVTAWKAAKKVVNPSS